MKKKVLGASEALQRGVGKVVFADGRIDAPITGCAGRQGHGDFVKRSTNSHEHTCTTAWAQCGVR